MPQPKRELIEVGSGAAARVFMTVRAHEEYRRICDSDQERDVQRARSINRYIRRYCDIERHNLSNQQFKKLGTYSDGVGGKVDIWEFKAFAWRLYGSAFNVNGTKTFVGVRVDPDKKQDRANQQFLDLAAKEVGALSIYPGQQGGRGVGDKKDGKQGRKGRSGKGGG